MHVACAGSGEEAVDILRKDSSIDVCIVDIRLPGMNGDNTIRALHEISPGLKFIIHTGSADYSIPDDLRAIGIDERQLFAKPLLDMTPLVESVDELTGGRG